MFQFLYNIGVNIYTLFIKIAALFNEKAKLWVAGRHNWQQRYQEAWKLINPKYAPTVWVHCASLGEFEQGRPVIEALKKHYPEVKILLTFFSPSGFEIRKHYHHADFICYLPADSPSNALKFIEIFQPHLAIFVKYEFWIHYLNTLHKKDIPALLISAIFHQNQPFFKPYGGIFRKLLPKFRHIFVQNQSSKELLQKLGLKNYTLSGDTRIDRVAKIAEEAPEFPVIQAFAEKHNILVCGSTWPPDEAILAPFINTYLPKNWKVIIAPHQINEIHLLHIEKPLQKTTIRYSKASPENAGSTRVLLIDNIGMLAALYRYGRVAYIGGGFGTGIHNTLEPITFGLPVIFGPKFQKFEEAIQLTQRDGAFTIKDLADFKAVFQQLREEHFYQQASATALRYVQENRGATAQIMDFIQNKKLLQAPNS